MFSYAFDIKYADLKQKMCMECNNKGKFVKYFVKFLFGRLTFFRKNGNNEDFMKLMLKPNYKNYVRNSQKLILFHNIQ